MAVIARPRRAAARLACCAAVLGVACSRPAPAGLGRRVAEGQVLAVRAAADGARLAFLHRCEPVRDRALPPGTAACALAVIAPAGGDAVEVARGVTTLPQGFAWSGAGHVLIALAGYDPAAGEGALVIWDGGAPRRLAERAGFYALDRDGTRVGWVAGEQLFVAPVAGAPAAVDGARGIATFEFGAGRGGPALLARRSALRGGELLAVERGAAARVASDVRDYGFAHDGARFAYTAGTAQALAVALDAAPGRSLAREVRGFLFSPRGDAIAYLADAAPGKQGDLWVAPLGGGTPTRLAQRAGEPRWSADGSRLAWLEAYDPRARVGTLGAGGPGAAPLALARNVSDFDLTPDGTAVAYLVHETAGGYSVDLGLARLGGDHPVTSTIARGVFGFSFSPDGRWLYYRTACTREAQACDLLRVPAAGLAPGAQPERIAQGVKSYEFAPGRPDRLLVSWARLDRVALDLAVWEGGKLTAVDTYALPGSAQFVGGDARRVAYAVVDAKRAGVYVAEVP